MKIVVNTHNYIKFVILATPIMDILNGITDLYSADLVFLPGPIIRSILFLFCEILLFIQSAKKGLLIFLLFLLSVFRNLFYLGIFDASLIPNMSFDIKYLYTLSFYFLLLSCVKNKQLKLAEVIKWSKQSILFCAFVTLFSRFFEVGLYYAGSNKGFFMEVNSLTAVLAFGVSLYLPSLFQNKIAIKEILKCIIVVLPTAMLATKTGIISVIVTCIFCFFYMGRLKKAIRWLVAFALFSIVAVYIYDYFTSGNGLSIIQRWQYFFNNLDVVSFILSSRNKSLELGFQVWISSPLFIIIGLGQVMGSNLMRDIAIHAQGIIEMDLFDLFYFCGSVVGIIISSKLIKQFFCACKRLIKRDGNGQIQFSYIIMFFILALGGHVLTSPFAGIYFANCLFLSKCEGGES